MFSKLILSLIPLSISLLFAEISKNPNKTNQTKSQKVRKFKLTIPVLPKNSKKEVEFDITAMEILLFIFKKHGEDMYKIVQNDKAFEDEVKNAYRSIKLNRKKSEIISTYTTEDDLSSSLRSAWEFSKKVCKSKRLSAILAEITESSEEEELIAEKQLELSPENAISGFYASVNSAQDADTISNTTTLTDSSDLKDRKQTFLSIAGKFCTVKPITSLSGKNYMTISEILAYFGQEFLSLKNAPEGECTQPILRKLNNKFVVFFIEKNTQIKPTRSELKKRVIARKLSKMVDDYKEKNNIVINKPNDMLNEECFICQIDDLKIRVSEVLRFLEIRMPGKNIKKLISSMPKSKADSFVETAISSLVYLLIQSKIAESMLIEQDEFIIPDAELSYFLGRIAKCMISEDLIKQEYEKLKDQEIYKSRIKYDVISVESQSIATSILSALQGNSLQPLSATAFSELKKKYSLDVGPSKDSMQSDFTKMFPYLKETFSSDAKILFDSITAGKIYIFADKDQYYIVSIDSIYTQLPLYDELKQEIITSKQAEISSSIVEDTEITKLPLTENIPSDLDNSNNNTNNNDNINYNTEKDNNNNNNPQLQDQT